jgi:regulator of sigma E protease
MLHYLSNTLAFIFALGVIIFVHEAGHLLVAKAFKMRVLAFSLGFGKKIWGFQRGETEYKVSAIPLGGYVKLSGEDAGESDKSDPRDFLNQPRWQRILVYLAGPGMNAVFSVLVIAALFMVGIEVPSLQSVPSIIGTVEAGSEGARAGLAAGDKIVAIDGRETDRWQDVAFPIMTSIGKPLTLEVERGAERRTVTVTPAKPADFDFGDVGIFPQLLPRVGEIVAGGAAEAAGFRVGDEIRSVDGRGLGGPGEFVTYIEEHKGQSVAVEVLRDGERLTLAVVPADQGGKGKIGVRLTIAQRYPPLQALSESVRFNVDIARQSLAVIGKIFTREVAAKNALAGPIEIAAQSGAAARTGWKNLFYLMGVLSLSIGLLNLFPIPILDGGQIAILLFESIVRRDLSLAVKERIAQVGFALVVLLMVTVLWFDLSKNLF